MLKGGKLEETHDLKTSTRRLGHNKSIRFLKNRQNNTTVGDDWL
jgi:hypothetical protein